METKDWSVSVSQLASFLKKKSVRAESLTNYKSMKVLGVSNKIGITVTGHKPSKDLVKYQLIEEGDFAYNPYRINVGSIGLVPKEVRGLVSPAYVVFSTTDKLLPELLFHFLKSTEGLFEISKYSRGTVRKALRFQDLCQISMPIPTIDKQIFIIEKKRKVETEESKLKEEITHQQILLKKLRQQILQDAIEGKLTAEWRQQNPDVEPASELLTRIQAEKEQLIKDKKIKKQQPLPPIGDAEKPFDLPERWVWCRLNDLFDFIDYRGKTPNKLKHGIRLITARNVKNGVLFIEPEDFISEEEYKERMTRGFPKKGDLLFTTEAPLGNVCMLNIDNEKISTGQRLITLQSYYFELENKMQMFFILSPFYQEFLVKKATGMTAKGIKASRLKEMLIPLPPLPEQKAIVAKVEKLLALCDQMETQITDSQIHAKQLMQAVLKEAFSQTSEKSDQIATLTKLSSPLN